MANPGSRLHPRMAIMALTLTSLATAGSAGATHYGGHLPGTKPKPAPQQAPAKPAPRPSREGRAPVSDPVPTPRSQPGPMVPAPPLPPPAPRETLVDAAVARIAVVTDRKTGIPRIELRIGNRGRAAVPAGVSVALWAWPAGSHGRIHLGRVRYQRSIGPGATSTPISRPLPAGLALKGARLCALVDPDGRLRDRDRSNNRACTTMGVGGMAASRPGATPAWRLDALPVGPAALDALARGRMRGYILVRLDRAGRMVSRERVRALVGAWQPQPADMQPARAFVRFSGGHTVAAGDWYWSDTGNLWLPLTGDSGRMMGVLAVSRDGQVRLTLDVDGDGVADIAARESLATGEAILMFPEGDPWRALVEVMVARRDVCAAAREAGLAGTGRPAAGSGFMPGSVGTAASTRRLPLCGRPGGGAGGASRTGQTTDDERCAEVLARTPASPEGGPPDIVRSEGGSTRNLIRNSRDFAIGLLCPPCGVAIAGRKILAAFAGGGTLRTVIKEAASAANPYVGITFVIGDYMSERGSEVQREEYVNEYDEMLHDMESMCGGLGPDECAARKGVKPDWRTVRRACGAGSSSTYCQDPKWAQPPQRVSGGNAKPLPDGDRGSGRTLDELMARACRERARYRDRVRGALLGPVEEECPDPRSQPSPAESAGRAAPGGKRDAPVRMRTYCAEGQERETRSPPAVLADILGRGQCLDPTAQSRNPDGESGPTGRRCVRGKIFGLGAGRGTIGVAYGTVVGIEACPEATCDPASTGR